MVNRVDGAVTLSLPGISAIKNLGYSNDDIVEISPPIQSKKYYVLISKQFVKLHPEIAEKIWKISRLVGEEVFDLIVEKYL